jgi:hypothetical protein
MAITKPYTLLYVSKESKFPVAGLKNLIVVHVFLEYERTIEELGVPQLLMIEKELVEKHHWLKPIESSIEPKKFKKHQEIVKFPKYFSYKFIGDKNISVEDECNKLNHLVVSNGTF